MVNFNLTKIALTLFGLYLANCLYILYHFFNVPDCTGRQNKCLSPRSMKGQILEVKLTSFYIDIHVDISGIDLYLFIIVIFTIIIH